MVLASVTIISHVGIGNVHTIMFNTTSWRNNSDHTNRDRFHAVNHKMNDQMKRVVVVMTIFTDNGVIHVITLTPKNTTSKQLMAE